MKARSLNKDEHVGWGLLILVTKNDSFIICQKWAKRHGAVAKSGPKIEELV